MGTDCSGGTTRNSPETYLAHQHQHLQRSCWNLSPLTMADWDAEDFEPDTAAASVITLPSDKWDGEDEEDDIKDAWDAKSDDEDKSEKSEEAKPVKVKKKKTLAQKIAEKEEAAEQARLEKIKMEQEEMEANTPEGKLAEKMRLQKLTEDNDLKITQDMFGADAVGGLDAMNPQTKEEFEDFAKTVLDKITSLESSEHFQDFAEEFVRNLCMSLNVQTLKKCKTHVEAFHSAKLKEEKAATGKGKKGKNPLKSLKMDRDSTTNYYDGYNDMDDFM